MRYSLVILQGFNQPISNKTCKRLSRFPSTETFWIYMTPADQMNDKSGFDIWCECHLIDFRFVCKINL